MATNNQSERDELLEIIADQVREIDGLLAEYDPDHDDIEAQRLQIRWIRALGYLSGQYRQLMKDSDLDDMRMELDAINEIREITNE